MAIIHSVPGLEVTIQVNGETATEYDDPHMEDSTDDDGVVTRYIESITDSEFAVKAEVSDEYDWDYKGHDLVVYVYVDGEKMDNRLITRFSEDQSATIYGAKTKNFWDLGWTLRRFKFRELKIRSNNRQRKRLPTNQSLTELGVIKVEIQREIVGGKVPMHQVSHQEVTTQTLSLTEERIKGRAVSHGTELARAESVPPTDVYDAEPLEEDNGPIATFRFVYRSLESLKQEMVIERTPSPDPVDSMSIEELRQLARERLAMPMKRIKSECSEDENEDEDGILDLTRTKRRKRARRNVRVDLTR